MLYTCLGQCVGPSPVPLFSGIALPSSRTEFTAGRCSEAKLLLHCFPESASGGNRIRHTVATLSRNTTVTGYSLFFLHHSALCVSVSRRIGCSMFASYSVVRRLASAVRRPTYSARTIPSEGAITPRWFRASMNTVIGWRLRTCRTPSSSKAIGICSRRSQCTKFSSSV